jgi:hypothetical protein
MPTGWSVDNSAGSSTSASGCLARLQSGPQVKGLTRAKVGYAQGQSIPAVTETLISGRNASKRYNQFVHILNSCKTVSFNSNGTTVSGSMGAMSLPTVGDGSKAYALSVSADGINLGADIVLFKEGTVDGQLIYMDLGTPDVTNLQGFVTAALQRIEGKTTTTPSSSTSQ